MCNLGQLPCKAPSGQPQVWAFSFSLLGVLFLGKEEKNAGTPSLENQMWHLEAEFPLVNKFHDETELNKAAN